MRCFHSITQADQITQLAMLLQQCSRVSNRKTIHWFKVTDLCYVTTISKSKEGSRCFFKKLHLESFMLILQISSRLLQINYLIHVSERHLMTGQCFKVQYPRLTVNATGRFEAANKSARDQKIWQQQRVNSHEPAEHNLFWLNQVSHQSWTERSGTETTSETFALG